MLVMESGTREGAAGLSASPPNAADVIVEVYVNGNAAKDDGLSASATASVRFAASAGSVAFYRYSVAGLAAGVQITEVIRSATDAFVSSVNQVSVTANPKTLVELPPASGTCSCNSSRYVATS